MSEIFHLIASRISALAGTPWAFMLAVIAISVWAIYGPVMGFSDSWQLIINTGTNITCLLMVFLIQNTQNRDSKAINLKLDELINAVRGARTGLVDLEDASDEEIEKLKEEFKKIRQKRARE